MATKDYTIRVEEELYNKFIALATSKGGPWRSRRDNHGKAMDSAIYYCLSHFVDKLGSVPTDAAARHNLARNAIYEIKAWSEKLLNILPNMK